MKRIFVAGTDTGVGKTVVSCGLAACLGRSGRRVGWQKWVATGLVEGVTDFEYCRKIAAGAVAMAGELHMPQTFQLPASPHLAAAVENRQVDVEAIRRAHDRLAAACDLLVVEGVGGVMVPLTRELLLVDLVAELGLPVLVVARSGLGTINHSLLTIEALRRRHITVAGILFSDEGPDLDPCLVADNMKVVGELGGVEVLGRLPFLTGDDWGEQYLGPVTERLFRQK